MCGCIEHDKDRSSMCVGPDSLRKQNLIHSSPSLTSDLVSDLLIACQKHSKLMICSFPFFFGVTVSINLSRVTDRTSELFFFYLSLRLEIKDRIDDVIALS